MRGVVEDVAGRRVDRDGPGVRRRVGLLAGVEGPRLRAEGGRVELRPCGSWCLLTVSVDKQKDRGSSVESAAPGPVFGPAAYVVERARDVRPQPLGWAAMRIHMSERWVVTARRWCRSEDVVRQPSRPKRNASARDAARLVGMTPIPADVPCLRRREGRAEGRRRGARRPRVRRVGPAGRRGRDPRRAGRASTTRTASPPEPTARSRGSTRSSRASIWPATVISSTDPAFAVGTNVLAHGYELGVPATAATRNTSACRPAGSCRWRPA